MSEKDPDPVERSPVKRTLTLEDVMEMVSSELRSRRGQKSWVSRCKYRCFKSRSNDDLEAMRSILLDVEEYGKDVR